MHPAWLVLGLLCSPSTLCRIIWGRSIAQGWAPVHEQSSLYPCAVRSLLACTVCPNTAQCIKSEERQRAAPCRAPEVGKIDAQLEEWLRVTQPQFVALHASLQEQHAADVRWLASAPQRARAAIWWPFTQHRSITDDKVTVITGRHGEHFLVATPPVDTPPVDTRKTPANTDGASTTAPSAGTSDVSVTSAEVRGMHASAAGSMDRLYDACASWWTQGMSAELQPLLTRSLAYSAGRFTHVIFPENVHRPALDLTELLLAGPGRNWASRVFFSDDGCARAPV